MLGFVRRLSVHVITGGSFMVITFVQNSVVLKMLFTLLIYLIPAPYESKLLANILCKDRRLKHEK